MILMTAFPTIENAGDAATAACDYLVKPFDLDDVVGAVEKKRNWDGHDRIVGRGAGPPSAACTTTPMSPATWPRPGRSTRI